MARWLTGSIRTKILLAFLIPTLVALLALGLIGVNQHEQSLGKDANASLRTYVTLQKDRLTELVGRYKTAANVTAADAELGQALNHLETTPQDQADQPRQAVAALLKARADAAGAGTRFAVVDATGKVLAASDGKTGAAVPAFGEADPGKEAVFRGPDKADDGALVGTVARRVAPAGGKPGGTGVLVCQFPWKLVDDLPADELVDLLGKDAEARLVSPPRTAGEESAFTPGKKVVAAAVTLPGFPNHGLVAELPRDVVYAPANALRLATLGVALLALAITGAIGYVLARHLTGQIRHITDVFGQIGFGNFQARARVATQDELGYLANGLNAMLDNTLALIQSRDERDTIQASIQRLLEEVSGVAEGDLTREAEVTADVTGAIADSFNYMIEQLRNIISNVQEATLQVSSSANEIQATAEHLAQGSETQAMQIVNTSAAIDEMAVSIQQVSENAAMSATVAQQALTNAKEGTHAVQNTIQGMNRIRDQVQETSKRIKRLGESSQEIGQIIQLIDDIADRTSILALNASIQAAMAGEAGRGFAVVAEEVERLAERATDATKKIATLVKTIQSETNEAGAAMEKGIQEVVEGSKLANQAGIALTEIEGVSNRLADLIQSISLASKQQARGSEALAKSMSEISQITQQTAAGTKQAAESVSNLATLADELRASVSTFRLPAETGSSPGGSFLMKRRGHTVPELLANGPAGTARPPNKPRTTNAELKL